MGQVATPDFATTSESQPVTFNITGNDIAILGTIDPATVDLESETNGQQTTTTTAQGSFSVDASGNLTFTPVPSYSGIASLLYTVKDNNDNTSLPGLVTITITPDNPPTANPDNTSTNEDVGVNLNVVANDTDAEGGLDPSTVDLNTTLAGIQTSNTTVAGTWSVDNTGVVSFTPLPNFNGLATLSYTVNDNLNQTSNVTTITITVNAINDLPVANDDAATTAEETTVTINVLANDTDPDGNATLNPGTVDLDITSIGIQNSNTTTAGAWSVNGAGVVSFTPALNYTSPPATLSYTVNDNTGATSAPATITVTITPVNDIPDAVDDVATTAEDTPVTINVTSNDTDVDGTINIATVDLDINSPGIQNANTAAGGSYSVNALGVVTFTPTANFYGSSSLSYTVNDNSGATSDPAIITITITPVNDAPVANGDATTTPEETTVTLNVISNDTDIDGTINPASVDLNTSAPGIQNTNTTGAGSWSVNPSGVVTFTPNDNFSGSATLTYTVNDNEALTSNQATISITVVATNDPPVANNDAATTAEDNSVSLNVVSNDTDEEGPVKASTVDLNTSVGGIQNSITVPGSGTFSVNGSGLVTFVPVLNFNGTVSITYTVEDSEGATSNLATITITVTSLNDAPVANNDAATTNEETPVTLNVVSNDTDVDDGINPASVDLNTSSSGIQTTASTDAGTWSVNSSGIVSFTPALDFSGPATLSYTVNDLSGATSAPALITITVIEVNDPPKANPDATSTNEGNAVSLNVVSNDTDPEGSLNPATVDLNTNTGGIQNTNSTEAGSWLVNGSGVVTFIPLSEFNGTATLSYTVNDNQGATSNAATITITVNPVNDPPVAVNDFATTNEETAVTLNVTTNDTDIDGTINVATVDLNVSSGGIQNAMSTTAGNYSVNALGVVTYTPAADYNGTATLNYTVNDNDGATSNQATISITVNPVNDPPVANNDAVSTNEDTPVTLNVVSNDTDLDGSINVSTVDLDPSSPGIQSTATISGGTISVNASGVITFTPTTNFNGLTTATYTVNDNSGATSNIATISITVIPVNDPPIANNDLTSSDEGEEVTINVVANDIDSDGTVDPSTVDLNLSLGGIQNTITTTAGTFTVNSSGIVTYTPAVNFNGVASITYTVRDNEGATSNAATISISVNSVNSVPIAVNDAATTNEEVPVSVTILSNDSDPDGTLNATTVDLNPAIAGIQNSITTASGTFTVNPSGVLTFTPLTNFHGTASITYTVNDNVGATSNIATVTITVVSINDPPVANNDAATTQEGTAVTLNVVANDTDVDGTIDPATVDLNTTTGGIQNTNTTAAGSWSASATGIVTFTPVPYFNGTATLSYQVNDNNGGTSNVAIITITVTSVNDPPVANNDAATTNEDVAVTLNVVANDTDVDGNVIASSVDLNQTLPGIQNTITTAEGTFTVNASGVVTFTPVHNFHGKATTTYTVNDNGGLTSNAATITITVVDVNDLPVANNDVATTLENTAVIIHVLSNDTDEDGTINPATVDLNTTTAGIQSTNNTAAGAWSVNAAGVVTFIPANNFAGTATLLYRVNDDDGGTSNAATITVTVTAVNDAPVANNDAATTNEDVTVTINVVANDTDDEGPVNAATVDLNTTMAGIQNSITVTGGTFTVNNTGLVTFTPVLNFNGTVTITYTVNDSGGLTSNVATITITVNPVNDAPVANNDAVTTNEDTPITFNVLTNDTDVDGTLDAATVDLNVGLAGIQNTNTTAQGTFTVNATGDVTFTPIANYAGSATISYRVNDDLGATSNAATITVTILAVNDPPIFAEIPNQRVLRNAAQKTITVTGISPGPLETESLLLTALSGNTNLIPHPVVTYNGTGTTATIVFQPNPNQTGSATITVRLVDTGLNTYLQTFTIDVVDVRITSTPVTVAVEGELYTYFVEVTDVTETLTLAAVQKPAWATLTTVSKNRGRLSGTVGAAGGPVKIQVKDGSAVVDEQNFDIIVNHRPVTASFQVPIDEDQIYAFEALRFQNAYTDQDAQALSEIQFTKLPKHGTLQFSNGGVIAAGTKVPFGSIGTVRYRPFQDYNGQDTLYFKVSDGLSYSLANTYVDFVIAPVNDPPVINGIESEALLYELIKRTPIVLTPLFNATDPDDLTLASAELRFSQNYSPNNDKLLFTNTSTITGSFNTQSGSLKLTGTASVQEYIQAIQSVQYVYENFMAEGDYSERRVGISLYDGKVSSAEIQRTIILIDGADVRLDIPNVFTPDGNTHNDVWIISPENADPDVGNNALLRIYDRRGKLVFETIGLDPGWNGRSSSGEELPVGNYFYTIDLRHSRTDKDLFKGTVSILR